MQSGGDPDSDSGMGEKFYLTAITYFWEVDKLTDIIAGLTNVTYLKQPGEAIFSLILSVDTLFGVPRGVSVTGLNMDVDRAVYTAESHEGNLSAAVNFIKAAGIAGSNSEHGIMEQAFRVASISAVKVIQIANAEGLKIYHIVSANLETILPLLQVSGEVKTDIVNAVNSGKEVLIPEHELTVSQWSGIGYIISDPATGAGAYLISGGSGGVDTIEKKEMVMEIQRGISLWDLITCLIADSNFINEFGTLLLAIAIFTLPIFTAVIYTIAILVVYFALIAGLTQEVWNCEDLLQSPHVRIKRIMYAV
jgi:hypothetical protein